MSISVRDETAHRDQMIETAVKIIGQSQDRLKFFKAMYDGKQITRDQEFLKSKGNFPSTKRVLEIGKTFAIGKIIKQIKGDNNKIAYEKIDFYSQNKSNILLAVKRNNGSGHITKPKLVFEKRRTITTSSKQSMNKTWDVFICHASEDKKSIAKPLVDKLTEAGVDVWYDEFELDWGSHLMQSINYGLKKSLFGIVILSKSFFKKEWAQRELAGLHSLSIANKQNKILPLLYKINHDELINYSPLLSDIVYKQWNEGLQIITQSVKKLVNKRKGIKS